MTSALVSPTGCAETSCAAAEATPPLDALRVDAFATFLADGFPAPDDEDWRFTDITALVKAKFAVAPAAVDARAAALAEQHSLAGEAAVELVFVNGHYAPDLSTTRGLPAGVTLRTLGCQQGPAHPADLLCRLGRCASVRRDRFVTLNTCFFRDGVAVQFAPGVVVERPIHVLCLSSGQDTPIINSPRVLVVADPGSSGTVIETHAGAGGGSLVFNNVVTEIDVAADATIRHIKLHADAPDTYHIGVVQATLATRARLHAHAVTIGGDLVRTDTRVVLAEAGAEAELDGLVLIEGTRHAANHTRLEHAAPDCRSRELYKHLLDDAATGVFKGGILVHPAAQRTDARMNSRTLLMSDKAVMHALPLLEINADDVKCAHGATTGPMDDDQVFYQRSRGIPETTARRLLGYAFAADVTRRIPVATIRRRIETRLAAHHGLPDEVVL